MKPQIYHVDAFTSEPFRGNSAGVVLHADTLSDAQMQLIARELRHSETAFLLKSEESDVRIRYFTPTVEVPICGHATVAAHYVRATVLGLGNTTVWQTSLAGRHRVEIHAEHNDYRITLEQGQPSFEPPLVGEIRAAIITALNLTEDDIVPGAPIQVASTGHAKVMILLKRLFSFPDSSGKKRNRWANVFPGDRDCGRSGNGKRQWPDGCMARPSWSDGA